MGQESQQVAREDPKDEKKDNYNDHLAAGRCHRVHDVVFRVEAGQSRFLVGGDLSENLFCLVVSVVDNRAYLLFSLRLQKRLNSLRDNLKHLALETYPQSCSRRRK